MGSTKAHTVYNHLSASELTTGLFLKVYQLLLKIYFPTEILNVVFLLEAD